MTKIYAYKQDASGIISAAEAESNGISIVGLHLAGIAQIAELARTEGDASAFGGPVLCRDGQYEYNFDVHCYIPMKEDAQ